MGPSIGPAKRAPANEGIAKPLSRAFQTSANAPPTMAAGEAPKKPAHHEDMLAR